MAQREEIILDIRIEDGDGKKRLGEIIAELERNRAALSNVRKEIRQVAQAQKQLDDALSSGKISAEAYQQQTNILRAKTDQLGQSAANLIVRQKELSTEQRNIARQIDITTKSANEQSGSLNQLRARLSQLVIQYDKLGKAEREAANNGQLLLKDIDSLQAEILQLEQATGRSQRNVGNYGSALKGLGGNVGQLAGQIPGLGGAVSALSGGPLVAGAAAIGVVVAGLKSAVEQAAEFEQAVKVLGVIAGATDDELTQLSDSAKEIGSNTQFSAPQVVELQTELARLGFTVPEILSATEAISNLAIITQEDLGASAETVAQVINAYGLTADDATNVTNVLAEAFNRTSLDLSKFNFALRQVGPTASAVGIDLEGTSAAIGVLTDIGLTGEQAGTGLRNTLLQLSDANSKLGQRVGFSVKSSEDFVKALEILKGQSIDAAQAAELVGKDGAASLLGMINNSEKVNELFGQFSNVEADAAAKAAAKVGDTLGGSLNRAKSSISGLAIEIGEALTPAVRFFVDLFTDGINEVLAIIEDFKFVFSVIQGAIEDVEKPISDVFSAIKAAINSVGGPLKDIISFVEAAINKVKQFTSFFDKFKSENKSAFGIREARLASEAKASSQSPTVKSGATPRSESTEIEEAKKKQAALDLIRSQEVEAEKKAADQRIAEAKRVADEQKKLRIAALNEEIAFLQLQQLSAVKNSERSLEIEKQLIEAKTRLKLESVTGANAALLVEAEAAQEQARIDRILEVERQGLQSIGFQKIDAEKQTQDLLSEVRQQANQADIAQNKERNAELLAQDKERAAKSAEIEKQRQALNQEVQGQAIDLAKQGVQVAAQLLVKNKEDEKAVARANLIASYINELGAIAFRAAQNPANAVTAGGAGIAQYAALAGISTGRFLLGLATIQGLNKGGIVQGVGNSDTVPTMLTPGEIVINKAAAKQFAPFLDIVNRSTGGNPILPGNQAAQSAGIIASGRTLSVDVSRQQTNELARFVESLPSPVVSVKEINETQKRVSVKERISRLK